MFFASLRLRLPEITSDLYLILVIYRNISPTLLYLSLNFCAAIVIPITFIYKYNNFLLLNFISLRNKESKIYS